MERVDIITKIGREFLTSNVENGEYSYPKAAGSIQRLEHLLGYKPEHTYLDIRFEDGEYVVLVETKQKFKDSDANQLREYLASERALHSGKKIICILANTSDTEIRVWQSEVDDAHILDNENAIDTMEHYKSLFAITTQNNREKVLKNTYSLNETLHKKDIDERLRSQFVGTALLYIKSVIKDLGIVSINKNSRDELKKYWNSRRSEKTIRSEIEETLTDLLDGSDNKTLKIELLQKNVLKDQKVKKLTKEDWRDVLDEIVWNIFKYINVQSAEGQDILNLFFIAFNKYTGKADKNQAFTPDHITNFMCRATGVDSTKRLFDGTCGSGSFLVQGMVLELADVNKQNVPEEKKQELREKVVKKHIFGIEVEEKAFGLATTNMLIHGDGNSNIKFIPRYGIFDEKGRAFIKEADPDIILMNPPYNAKPINIPDVYKDNWKKDVKEDPTKGMVFLKYISEVIHEMNVERVDNGDKPKEVKVAILLPVAAAIGTSEVISNIKAELLKHNTLEAVFTLPNEIFYPGASASACCMIFTLGRPHVNVDETVNKTFFGYYKEDGHKKKKNLGRIEQFNKENNSIWKDIEKKWLALFRNKTVEDGMSAMQAVSGEDEWLCEAYMKTDYTKLSEADFQRTLNNFLAYQMKEGKIYEG